MLLCFKSEAEKALSKEELKKCQEVMLEEKFPFKRYVITILLNLIIGLSVIGFQIAGIILKSRLYFVGVG